tara:strand:+ start:14711 stop:15622 length:912 start_codon:yes stop_codon:yes gene_type:complete
LKIKAVVIGYGSIGRKHLKILSEMDELEELFVLSKQKKVPCEAIKNIESILKIDPDYVIVSSPTSFHYEQLKFLDKNLQGKKILVEKPLFSTLEDLEIKNNRVYIDYNLRFNPVIQSVKEIIRNQVIYSVNVFCGSDLRTWRNNISYNNSSSALKKLGGGVLLELSHELDYLRWIFGELEVTYAENTKISHLQIETDDFLSLNGLLSSDIRLHLDLNYFSNIPIRRMIIDGKDISLIADLINNSLRIWRKGEEETKDFPDYQRDQSFQEVHSNILYGRDENICSFKEGLEVMEIINKIRKFST